MELAAMNGTPAPQDGRPAQLNNYPGTPPPLDPYYHPFVHSQALTQYPQGPPQQQTMQYPQQQQSYSQHYQTPPPPPPDPGIHTQYPQQDSYIQQQTRVTTQPEIKPLSTSPTRPVSQMAPAASSSTVPQYHARHWTPPTGGQQEWETDMCDCFDDWKICCLGMWFPCILYSRIYRRLRTDPSKLGGDFSHCNMMACMHCFCGSHAKAARQRSEIRYRYNLQGSECGDFWRHYCCSPCSLCQEEREVRSREKAHRTLQGMQTNGGYEKIPAMMYGK